MEYLYTPSFIFCSILAIVLSVWISEDSIHRAKLLKFLILLYVKQTLNCSLYNGDTMAFLRCCHFFVHKAVFEINKEDER